MELKLIIAGGTGFLGQELSRYFSELGYEIVVLSRSAKKLSWGRAVYWDGSQFGDWVAELENAHAVINLAGQSVNCRYTAKNRKILRDSRLHSTRILGEAIYQTKVPPKVWLNASTATIYQHSFDEPHSENGQIGCG